MSVFRALLGRDNYEDMRDVEPFLGPAMFVFWTVIGQFVITNLFFAILAEADLSTSRTGDNAGGVLDTATAVWNSIKHAQERRKELFELTAHVRESRKRLKKLPPKAMRTKEQLLLGEALEMQKEEATRKLMTADARRQAEIDAHEAKQEERFEAIDLRTARIVATVNSLHAAMNKLDKEKEEAKKPKLLGIATEQRHSIHHHGPPRANAGSGGSSLVGSIVSSVEGMRSIDAVAKLKKR